METTAGGIVLALAKRLEGESPFWTVTSPSASAK
jgi:hypothetical protein